MYGISSVQTNFLDSNQQASDFEQTILSNQNMLPVLRAVNKPIPKGTPHSADDKVTGSLLELKNDHDFDQWIQTEIEGAFKEVGYTL